MIRWIKLMKVAEELTGKKIKITITSELDDWRGLCVKEGNSFHILFNVRWAKTEEDVMETMAHELAHIDHPNTHNKDFQKRMNGLYKQLKIKMSNRKKPKRRKKTSRKS